MKKPMVISLVLSFLLLAVPQVSAEDGYGRLLTLLHEGEENYFQLKGEPGQSMELEFMLENRSGSEITNHILIYDSANV